MSPAVVKEKSKGEKRKKDEKDRNESGNVGQSENPAPPSKQVRQESGKTKVDKIDPSKQVDLYKEICSLELKESSTRTQEEDEVLFKDCCSKLRKLLGDLYSLKLDQSETAKAELKEKRIQASLLFVQFKKLNRLEKLRMRTARERTNSAKQRVDQCNLQLQNLRYEVLHLNKEVSRCINFWSADEQVDLVDEEDFYANAPEEVSKPEITKVDRHQQKLARLVWELQSRKRLDQEAHSLEDVKSQKEAVVNGKDDKLKELGTHLKRILSSTRPVQTSLGLPLDAERGQKNLAADLPGPLYILYSQSDAYMRSIESKFLNVEIAGDAAKAKTFRYAEASGTEIGDDEADDTKGKGGVGGEKKIDARSSMESKQSRLFCKHPLSVILAIKTEAEDEISITFHYLPHLNIVTVQGRINMKHANFSGDVVEVGSVLDQLYEGDEGLHSPNLQNEFQLKEAGISSSDASKLINECGSPFIWAQKLAGLNFLGKTGVDADISFNHIQTTVHIIKKRLESRVSLQHQLSQLDKGKQFKWDSLPVVVTHKYPINVLSTLKTWNQITWEKFSQHEETSFASQNGVVDSSDFLFKAVFTRGIATMTALVSLKHDYPDSCPVFCLSLFWKEKWTAASNEWIRDLEKELNFVADEEKTDYLLSQQVHKLCVLMDVLLESVSALDAEPVFTSEKNIQSPVQGRQRKLPFVFDMEEKTFSQR